MATLNEILIINTFCKKIYFFHFEPKRWLNVMFVLTSTYPSLTLKGIEINTVGATNVHTIVLLESIGTVLNGSVLYILMGEMVFLLMIG